MSIHAAWVLLVGLAIISAGLLKSGMNALGMPAMVGYLVLGVLLRLADVYTGVLTPPVRHAFEFLADVGVIALLFRVGLDSHPGALARKLPEATSVWLGNVVAAAVLGFVAAYYALGLALPTSLVIATALTATSVGVSVAPWQEANALGSDNGRLLLDVAELDDVSAVALMALVLAMIPVLGGDGAALSAALLPTAAAFVTKLIFFIGFCYLFSRFLEARITHFTARLEPAPERMLTVAGVGFVIAAFADWLGFSLAIGALFAGLVFSRDPEAVKTESSFQELYAFFTPFFFINIGIHVDPAHLSGGAGIGLVLLVAAVLGKFVGAGLPALLTTGAAGATLLGVSMIPRAEIALVVLHRGRQLGEAIVPGEVYSGAVFVSAATCIAAPLVLHRLLRRWPQAEGGGQ